MEFKIDKTYARTKDIHKNLVINLKSINQATMKTENNIIIGIVLIREENHLNILDSYIEIEFIVSNNTRGVFGNDHYFDQLALTLVVIEFLNR